MPASLRDNVAIINNHKALEFDTSLSSSELISLFKDLDIVCPESKFWDAIWTLIYVKDKNIQLPPKGKDAKQVKENTKRELFFTHIKQAEKCGKLPHVISFMNKMGIKNFSQHL